MKKRTLAIHKVDLATAKICCLLTSKSQVVFNMACFVGLLQDDDGAQSAAGCSSAACAAVTRLLLLLVPQFAVPGSRTARNCERNARGVLQSFSSRTASVVPAATMQAPLHFDDEDCSRSITLDAITLDELAWQRVDEHRDEQPSSSRPDPASTETSSEATRSETYERFRLRISCSDLLDCDIFSKSDPYAIVSELSGGRRQAAVELGRTEVIQDDLNPMFKTCIEVTYRSSDAQVIALKA